MVDHTCSLRTWEGKEEGLVVQDRPLLHSKFEDTFLGYMTFYGQSSGDIFSVETSSLKRFYLDCVKLTEN